jgi:hypothetical protein
MNMTLLFAIMGSVTLMILLGVVWALTRRGDAKMERVRRAQRDYLQRNLRRVGAHAEPLIQAQPAYQPPKDCAFEDVYYEHCSYFSAGSLARLFRRLGLRVLSYDIAYDGQYLTVEAAYPGSAQLGRNEPPLDDLAELAGYVSDFPARVARTLGEWQQRLTQWKQTGKKVVIWGSGSKGVSFLTGVPGADAVSHAVDINPYRSGYYMPATGQQIVGPRQLTEIRPDVVIVMNRVYVQEISQTLAELGLKPEVHAL